VGIVPPSFKRDPFTVNLFGRFSKQARVAVTGFSRVHGATPKNLLSNRSKEFELVDFKKLCGN
jgi:hypothetical protein